MLGSICMLNDFFSFTNCKVISFPNLVYGFILLLTCFLFLGGNAPVTADIT